MNSPTFAPAASSPEEVSSQREVFSPFGDLRVNSQIPSPPLGGEMSRSDRGGSSHSDQIGLEMGSPLCLRHLPRKGGEEDLCKGLRAGGGNGIEAQVSKGGALEGLQHTLPGSDLFTAEIVLDSRRLPKHDRLPTFGVPFWPRQVVSRRIAGSCERQPGVHRQLG